MVVGIYSRTHLDKCESRYMVGAFHPSRQIDLGVLDAGVQEHAGTDPTRIRKSDKYVWINHVGRCWHLTGACDPMKNERVFLGACTFQKKALMISSMLCMRGNPS